MSPGEPRARRLVEARLGRPPQDALEAAVVLEAWAGVPAQQALETARALMPASPAEPLVSAAAPVTVKCPPGLALEGAAFLVTVVAIALWAEPLSAALGVDAVERSLRIALPLTVALQSALHVRHLGRPSGLTGLADRGGALVGGAFAIVLVLALALGQPGLLAGLLTVTWTGGTILIRRGWALGYCVPVLAAVPLLLAGAPALIAVAAVAVATALGVAWALRTTATGTAAPGRWSRTLGAGLCGGGVGLLLVADPSVSWATGAAAALALLPSATGALWAGRYLWKLAGAFPHALAGLPACAAQVHPAPRGGQPGAEVRGRRRPTWIAARRERDGRASWPLEAGAETRGRSGSRLLGAFRSDRGGLQSPLATVLVALARYVALTVAGSTVLLALAPLGEGVGVLAAFGAVALATLLVGLLESLGRPSVAALGVAAGLVGLVLVRLVGLPFPGAAMLAGGMLALVVLVPGVLVLLVRPARTLATSLWIP